MLLLSRLYLAPHLHSPQILLFMASLLLVFLAQAPPKAMARFPMFQLLHSFPQEPTLGGPKTTRGFPCGIPFPSSHGPFTLLSILIVAPLLTKLFLVDCTGAWFFCLLLFALGVSAAFVALPTAPPVSVWPATNGFVFLTSAPVVLGEFGVPAICLTERPVIFSAVTYSLLNDPSDIYIPLVKLIRR